MDSNHRPLGYEPNELANCSIPQFYIKPETTASVLGLLSDYVFPSCPVSFGYYPNNAGDLSTPLFELLVWTTHLLLILFNPAGLINSCGAIDLSKISS